LPDENAARFPQGLSPKTWHSLVSVLLSDDGQVTEIVEGQYALNVPNSNLMARKKKRAKKPIQYHYVNENGEVGLAGIS